MREKLIEEMIKEVLGPRKGSEEKITGDPIKEYITGVIIPKKCSEPENSPDSEITNSPGGNISTDDDLNDEILLFTPSELNPKKRPSSFGISFVIKGKKPSFKICVTWARYVEINDNGKDEEDSKDKVSWKRIPDHIIKDVSLENEIEKILIYDKDDGQIFLYFRKIAQNTEINNIIIYMVNNLNFKKCSGKFLTKASIFQPALRILLNENTQIASLEGEKIQILDFLYRNKPVLARGYMCSAIWRQIDYMDYINGSVIWSDGYHFNDCQNFVKSDIRSEFVPLYPHAAPLFDWNKEEFGNPPELSTLKLSEMWEIKEIDEYLLPFILAYKNWITSNEITIKEISSDYRQFIDEIINTQKEGLKRLEMGIDILKKDENARLAFCFANRTIWLQDRWKNKWDKKKDEFKWRPFQLSFFLMTIESIYNKDSPNRNIIDLLWIPTGGGKTEAYLAIMAFTMALRRINARKKLDSLKIGGGTAIITRYTLRLLTVQQFRRTLRMVTAANYLRAMKIGSLFGWRPEKCNNKENYIYGSIRFSVGMWVGTAVTPNHLRKSRNAILILKGEEGDGDPAQIIKCPACDSWLAVPKAGLPVKENTFYMVGKTEKDLDSLKKIDIVNMIKIDSLKNIDFIKEGHSKGFVTLVLKLESNKNISENEIDNLYEKIKETTEVEIASFRASRPGYFGFGNEPGRRKIIPIDFEIYCPNPNCDLNKTLFYEEGVPLNFQKSIKKPFPDGLLNREIETPFIPNSRMPIPAYTVDEQIYHRLPTIIVSTADKIARLAFEPRAASIFGLVNNYNVYYGYYRDNLLPDDTTQTAKKNEYNISVNNFPPPELIIQDELHLMEGPLGSMFGLYETIVEGLILNNGLKPKYIASTATIKNAKFQVSQLFKRELFQFPPYGLDIENSFFVRTPSWKEAWDETRAGRIYMGIYAPAMGPLTPVIRIWSMLLATAQNNIKDKYIKYFWTIVGYFNALRELGGGRSLYREDIIERIKYISPKDKRVLDPEKIIELSSRIDSTNIPHILEDLETSINRNINENPDAIFTTSMFGTGVDIPHLSLMVVDGQPKTTSQYIQATGRVGRTHGGLVVTFLRAGRSRDLSHYEMFATYHHRIYIEVEPISVSPFSDGTLAHAAGPSMVAFLRNMSNPSVEWFERDGKAVLNQNAINDFKLFIDTILQKRIENLIKKPSDIIRIIKYYESQRDLWVHTAIEIGTNDDLEFYEYCMFHKPKKNVVLGDPYHEYVKQLKIVFKNAPQSLREIEETIGFGV